MKQKLFDTAVVIEIDDTEVFENLVEGFTRYYSILH